MRGTFANVRLRNHLVPDKEGGYTRHLPSGDSMSIYDAAMAYAEENTPLVVLAGKEYGTGSSRDWAAKGPLLLGIKVVIAESLERIHRSNLIGMGVLPLTFLEGESAESLGLSGEEVFDVIGLDALNKEQGPPKQLEVIARSPDGDGEIKFKTRVRLDTPKEVEYYRHGGILQYVLRQIARPQDA